MLFKRSNVDDVIKAQSSARIKIQPRRGVTKHPVSESVTCWICYTNTHSLSRALQVLASSRLSSFIRSASSHLPFCLCLRAHKVESRSTNTTNINAARKTVYTRSLARSTKWQHKQSNRTSNARRQIRSNTGGARNMPNDDPMYQYNYKIQHRRCNQQTMSRSNQHIFWSKPSA